MAVGIKIDGEWSGIGKPLTIKGDFWKPQSLIVGTGDDVLNGRKRPDGIIIKEPYDRRYPDERPVLPIDQRYPDERPVLPPDQRYPDERPQRPDPDPRRVYTRRI